MRPLGHLPARLITGAYIAHAGWDKERSRDGECGAEHMGLTLLVDGRRS
jgi:hypothetical protein